MYLPSTFIYNDTKKLKWLPEIDSIYQVTGGKLYQANKFENGNYVFKYLGGVSILETPLFLIGHSIAKNTKYNRLGSKISWLTNAVFNSSFLGGIIKKISGVAVERSLPDISSFNFDKHLKNTDYQIQLIESELLN